MGSESGSDSFEVDFDIMGGQDVEEELPVGIACDDRSVAFNLVMSAKTYHPTSSFQFLQAS